MRETLARVDVQQSASFSTFLFRAQAAVFSGDANSLVVAEKHCSDGLLAVAQAWAELPEIVGDAHLALLQATQLFVEVQESTTFIRSAEAAVQVIIFHYFFLFRKSAKFCFFMFISRSNSNSSNKRIKK